MGNEWLIIGGIAVAAIIGMFVFKDQICASAPEFPLLCKPLDLGGFGGGGTGVTDSSGGDAESRLKLVGMYDTLLQKCPICAQGVNMPGCIECAKHNFS